MFTFAAGMELLVDGQPALLQVNINTVDHQVECSINSFYCNPSALKCLTALLESLDILTSQSGIPPTL